MKLWVKVSVENDEQFLHLNELRKKYEAKLNLHKVNDKETWFDFPNNTSAIGFATAVVLQFSKLSVTMGQMRKVWGRILPGLD